MTRRMGTRLALAMVAAMVVAAVSPVVPTEGRRSVTIRAAEVTLPVDRDQDFDLPDGTTHVAIHWPGHHAAEVTAAFSSDGQTFSEPIPVEHDEVGEARANGVTYGTLMVASGSSAVRVASDRPIPSVSVLALNAAPDRTPPLVLGATAVASAPIPSVISRAEWGADESLRFDSEGRERWTRAYYPLQKLVVHHTATTNGDPNPAATVRAIYYYHAVTQGWGDIGYQYLVDESGRVYEGRYSRDYPAGTSPTADNDEGLVVEGGHARYYNPGSLGIALLGNLQDRPPTSAARSALIQILAWAAVRHGVDPRIASTYVNPVTGTSKTTPNLGGHRDYNATACPGTLGYPTLPDIRSSVAASVIQRLAGADRYASAAAVSAATYGPNVPVVFIATGSNYPDALAAGPAAAAGGGPVLLVSSTSIPAATAAELTRLQPARIVVVGGTGVVSEGVRTALGAYPLWPASQVPRPPG